MLANEGREGHGGSARVPYLKPVLVTHGSVQQLTEGGHSNHGTPDCGSNIRFKPGPIGNSIFGEW